MKEKEAYAWKLHSSEQVFGLPTKERNTQAIALNLELFRIVYGYLMSEKAHNIKYYIIQLS